MPAPSSAVGDLDAFVVASLDYVNLTVEQVSTPAGPRFLLVDDGTDETTSLRARVRPDGLIERLETTIAFGGGTLTYRGTVEVRETSVEPPSWLPVGSNRTVNRSDGSHSPRIPRSVIFRGSSTASTSDSSR